MARNYRNLTSKPTKRLPWFLDNREVLARYNKAKRLKYRGLTPSGDKASLRAAADEAVATFRPKPR